MPKTALINDKEIEREIKRLSKRLDRESKGETNRAMTRVINRNVSSLMTHTVKEAAPRLDVKQKYIRPRIKLRKAKSNNMRAGIWVGTHSFKALAIGAKPAESGYSAGPYHWPNAFKWRNKKGQHIALQRKGRARYPLEAAQLGRAFVHRELKASADKAAVKVLQRDLNADLHREIRFRLGKFLTLK